MRLDTTKIINRIRKTNEPIMQYPYRSAHIDPECIYVLIEDIDYDIYNKILDKFAEATTLVYNSEKDLFMQMQGYRDNHCVFKIDNMYYQFTDRNIYIGDKIKIEYW